MRFLALFYVAKVSLQRGETPLIVNDPETHASQATIIGKMVDSIKRYEEIISKAQAQVNQLQKVNNMVKPPLAKARGFLTKAFH
ncbi:hypothetical protein HPHPH28_0295 [Helicobacter pylori Hp H-28]|nr:hypothetical protein HPHPH28_0295 [Helicobacter pylori Hp H-28]